MLFHPITLLNNYSAAAGPGSQQISKKEGTHKDKQQGKQILDIEGGAWRFETPISAYLFHKFKAKQTHVYVLLSFLFAIFPMNHFLEREGGKWKKLNNMYVH